MHWPKPVAYLHYLFIHHWTLDEKDIVPFMLASMSVPLKLLYNVYVNGMWLGVACGAMV